MLKYNLSSILYPSNKKHKTFIYTCHNIANLQTLRNIGCDYHIYGIKYNKDGEPPTIYGYIQFHSPKTEMRANNIIIDSISIMYTEKPANMIRNFKRYLSDVWETGVSPCSQTHLIVEQSNPTQEEIDNFIHEQSNLFQIKRDRIIAQMKENVRLFEEEEKEWQMKERDR